eukprot:4131526-Karenia_brevis.AAC.1
MFYRERDVAWLESQVFTKCKSHIVDEPKMEICTVEDEQWVHVETTIDSGAAETVCNPEMGSDYKL